jgi:hypothetical protein
VTITLSMKASSENWYAYASVPDNCNGLASFKIDVIASGGVAVTSSLMGAPRGLDPARGFFGFNVYKSNGTNGIGIQASQETGYAAPNDPEQDALVLLSVGTTAGNHLGVSWDAPVLLASGTYSGTQGVLEVRRGDGLFNVLNSSWQGPGHVTTADVVVPGSVIIPEPATIGLVLAGTTLLAMRRRVLRSSQRNIT